MNPPDSHPSAVTRAFWPSYLPVGAPEAVVRDLFDALRARVERAPMVSVDTETQAPLGHIDDDAKDVRVANLVGVSLGWKEPSLIPWDAAMPGAMSQNEHGPFTPSVYLPLRHALVPRAPGYVLEWLERLLADARKVKVFHFAPFDVPLLKWREGWTTKPPYLDTALFAWVYDETLPRGLKDLAARLLGWDPLGFADVAKVPFGTLPPEVAYRYACQDAHLPIHLLDFFVQHLHPGGLELVTQIEVPIQEAFMQMHFEGIPVDAHLLHRYEAALQEIVTGCAQLVRHYLGEVNVNAPEQLKRAFQGAGISLTNTTAATLRRLDHPAAKAVLQYRKFSMMSKTFIAGWQKEMWPDGKFHPRFLQWYYEERGKKGAGTRTGRSSSSKPNVQQAPRHAVPIPDNLELSPSTRALGAINMRDVWAVPEGEAFVKADASQLEPRVMAMVTGETLLVDMFNQGKNVYREVGKLALERGGQPPDPIEKGTHVYEMFKRCVLGQGYGAFPDTIQAQMEKDDIWVPLDRVEQIHGLVAAALPTVTQVYPMKVAAFIHRDGYIETVFHRRRHFSNFHPKDRGMLRQAVNFVMGQSPGFDVIKRAILQVGRVFRDRGMRARMIGQIHDEIMVRCPVDEAEAVACVLYDALTDQTHTEVFPYRVPLGAEVATGTRYGSMKTVDPHAPSTCPMPEEKSCTTIEVASTPEPVVAYGRSTVRECAALQAYTQIVSEAIPCVKCEFFAPYGHRKVGASGQITGPIDVCWVGSNPGVDEVDACEPFVGRSGRLLRQLAYDARLPIPPMNGALFVNALWCFSASSEGILDGHITNCRPFLDRILALARPRLIIALGGIAARSLLRVRGDLTMERMAGTWHDLPIGSRMLINYHPAFLLRSPGFQGKFIDNLAMARTWLESDARSDALEACARA